MPEVVQWFLSQDHPISVDVCQPFNEPRPAIIVLHGADGPTSRNNSYFRLANGIAVHGYVVFLVHYFDRTGTIRADRETTRDCFADWRKTIVDAVTFVAKHPRVRAEQIGLLGLSLGATLALSVSGRLADIRAVAEFCGVMPNPGAFMMRMPPTLIVHGNEDDIVRVEEAYKLERLLKKQGVPYEIEIYADEGHIFRAGAFLDSVRRTVVFFDRYLRPAKGALDGR